MQIRSSDGATVAGRGGPGIYVNGNQVLPPSAGNDPVWFDNGKILCNDEHSQLVSVNDHGGQRVVLEHTQLGSVGASRVAADSDNPSSDDWAAFLQDGRTGLYTSWGLNVPAGELYGMRDNAVFGRQNFQSPGGLCAWAVGEINANETLWDEPSAVVIEFHALSATEVVWTDGQRLLRVRELPPPDGLGQTCFGPRVFRIGDNLFLLEWRDGFGLVMRPWNDAKNGWIVDPGEAFGPCGLVVSDTEVALAWGRNPAEQDAPGRAVVNVTHPKVSLVAPPVEVPPDKPEPPEPEPIPPDPIPEPIPPDPIVPPEPEPQPPRERVVQISKSSLQEFTDQETVTEVEHPDAKQEGGAGLVALKTADGKFKSITPDGNWDDDKAEAGAWERFYPQGDGIYLHSDGGRTWSVAVLAKPVPLSTPATAATSKVPITSVPEPKKVGGKK